ncbi:putative Mg2+ transporter-C [Streptococcus pneumoniae]|nr:putative Mg2+ transporter-C [Streptococcus pneumoniae]
MTATSLGLSNIEIVVRIVLSVVIGSIIGLERGSKSQPAGIRTYSIVCLAACLIMMTNEYVSYKFGTGDPTRLGALLVAISVWGVISMFQPLKKYLQNRSKMIELYIVVKSTEAYNRVLVYCAENGIRMTDSRTAFGDVNSDRIEYFDVPDKKIASFITLELSGRFEHLRLMEEIANIVGVIYVEEIS